MLKKWAENGVQNDTCQTVQTDLIQKTAVWCTSDHVAKAKSYTYSTIRIIPSSYSV